MKLGFQEQNNGNGRKPLVTSDNLKFACAELGIPDDAHTLRRAARAFDLYHSGKVEHVNNHTFKVASQYDRERPYRVQIKQTPYLKAGCYAYCTCQDWMNYSGDQDLPDVNFWCKHSIAALVWLHNNNGNGRKRIANECGTEQAKAIQDKLNAQIDSQNNNGNGAGAVSKPAQTFFLFTSKVSCRRVALTPLARAMLAPNIFSLPIPGRKFIIIMVQKLLRRFTMRTVEFVTTKQAAEMLSVSITTICQMLHNGKLKGIKIGKEGKSSHWRINTKSLEDYIAKAI